MQQATITDDHSATRELLITAATDSASAELVGALFDFMLTLRRDQLGATAAMPVLVRLAAGGSMRACDLAQTMHLDQSTVSRHVASLEADGLVVRTPLEEDRRAHRVVLTPAGTAAAHDVVTSRVRQFESAVAHWPEDDVAGFARLLNAFVDGLSAHERTTA
jgi:DNA-binding MarR family transcriptional regulator